MKRLVKRLTSLAGTRRILLQFFRIPRRHWRRPGNAEEELLSGARAAQEEESLFVVAADAVVASEVDAVVASEADAAVASEADAVAASGVDAVVASEVDEAEAEETEHRCGNTCTCRDSYY
jgi:hypothetical protein